MNLHTILLEASTQIARRDAELLLAHTLQQPRTFLLAHTLQQPRTFLLAHPEAELSPQQQAIFENLVQRRASGVPLQYLTGLQEFYGLELRTTPAALIPRPETEHLVEAVLDWSRKQLKPLRILDIGTGTGAIAIAIAANEPQANILATDISFAALTLARYNALRLGFADRIHFLESDLFTSLNPADVSFVAPFDVIVSNPPYVPSTDAPTMQREVVDHEPHTALFAGPDGLEIYRRLIPLAYERLRESGLLALEFGFGQSDALAQLLNGWHNIHFLNDYANIPRIVLAERP